MKHTSLFKDFLDDVVDLNAKRVQLLDDSDEAIKTFIRGSTWTPTIKGFAPQGSWAHKTIIKPIAGSAFDADILVRVSAVAGWEPKDYINTLKRVFTDSGTYKDKVSSFSHCVTITYAGERKIDIAPLVVDRTHTGSEEVCNRTANAFETSAPGEYTRWFNERNGYSGKNSFRKVTRLLKYLRGIKQTFSCRSVLLTTLLGERISWIDKDTAAFADTPSALQTVLGRLDDWLQARPTRPVVANPSNSSEDFGALLSDTAYANFRSFVNKYRGWVDEAMAEDDFDASITAWQRVFGEEFGKDAVTKVVAKVDESRISTIGSLLSSIAHHHDNLVDAVQRFGTKILPASFYRPPHLREPSWPRSPDQSIDVYVSATHHARKDDTYGMLVPSGDAVPGRGGLWLEARLWAGGLIDDRFRVEWRVTNTGMAALSINQGRGDFYTADRGTRRWESLRYRGVHFVEAFVIRRHDNTLVGKSAPFNVVIE